MRLDCVKVFKLYYIKYKNVDNNNNNNNNILLSLCIQIIYIFFIENFFNTELDNDNVYYIINANRMVIKGWGFESLSYHLPFPKSL